VWDHTEQREFDLNQEPMTLSLICLQQARQNGLPAVERDCRRPSKTFEQSDVLVGTAMSRFLRDT